MQFRILGIKVFACQTICHAHVKLRNKTSQIQTFKLVNFYKKFRINVAKNSHKYTQMPYNIKSKSPKLNSHAILLSISVGQIKTKYICYFFFFSFLLLSEIVWTILVEGNSCWDGWLIRLTFYCSFYTIYIQMDACFNSKLIDDKTM